MPEKRTSKQKAGESARIKKVSAASHPAKQQRATDTQKKQTAKKTRVRRMATGQKTQKSPTRRPAPAAETVTLPDAVSLTARLRERMLRAELDEHLQKAMYRIAYTAGLCFMLVGGVYALAPQFTPVPQQTAAVITSGDDPLQTGDFTQTTIYEPSEFSFITTIPDIVSEALEVDFEATNALEVVAKMRIVGTNDALSLPVNQISDSKYRIKINPETLTPNYYKLSIYVRPLDGSELFVRSTQEFFVGYPEPTHNTTITYGPSEFAFLTTIPDNVVEKTNVDFQATNAEKVSVKLALVDATGYIDITHSALSNDKYRAVIDPTRIQGGYYKLQVFVKPLDGSNSYSRATPRFFRGSTAVEDWYNRDTTAGEEENSITQESEPETTTEKEETNLQTEDDPVETTVSGDQEQIPSTKEEAPRTTDFSETKFELLPPLELTIKDTATIKILAPANTASIDLYARQTNSLSARYVASAFNRQGTLVFVFDSKNLPNGEYEFFARTQYLSRNLVTQSITLTIQNTLLSRELTTRDETTTAPPEQERFTDTTIVAPEPTTSQVVSSTESKTLEILTDDTTNFEELFRRYALAQQTGDESLVRIARDELLRAREQVYQKMVANQSERDIADSVAVSLEERVNDIVDRVDTFETLRRERTAGESAIDSDGDGISDYDEINLYGTDPLSADTDGDGISDGVEIMRGLDPLVPDAEAIIRYESPKELIGLERPDVLKVEEVIPIIEEVTGVEPVLVAAEIRGQALPNSFVTLFVFSMPTVVTIKTDADGSFVYTFDKELEDGQHDVYVAVTDNTGRIVAHSNRFSFVKQAQAFTPVDEALSEVVNVSSIVERSSKDTYATTLGMAILALGLILFVLGVSIRKETHPVHQENASIDDTEDGPDAEVAGVVDGVKFVSQRREHIDAS